MFDDEGFRKGGTRKGYKELSVKTRFNASSGKSSSEGGGKGGYSKEVVFKIMPQIKSLSGVKATLNYISNNRDAEDRDANEIDPLSPLQEPNEQSLPVWNENGEKLEGQAIKDELASWGLRSNQENLSKKAKAMAPSERNDLAHKDKYSIRLGTHMIFSLPKSIGKNREKDIQASVQMTLSKTVGQSGHRYMFTTHNHEDRVHVHAVVKSYSESIHHSNKPKPLDLRKNDINEIRSAFAQELQVRGFEVTATRRIDRPELRKEIIKGNEPLHKNEKLQRFIGNRGDLSKGRGGRELVSLNWLDKLGRRAPAWHQKHAIGYLNTVNGTKHIENRLNTEDRAAKWNHIGSKGSPELKDVARDFQRVYGKDASKAIDSFSDLYKDDKRLASWTLENRPNLFGRNKEGLKVDVSKSLLHKAGSELNKVPQNERLMTDDHKSSLTRAIREETIKYEKTQEIKEKFFDAKAAKGATIHLAKEYEKYGDHDKEAVAELKRQTRLELTSDYGRNLADQSQTRNMAQQNDTAGRNQPAPRNEQQEQANALQQKIDEALKAFEQGAAERGRGKGHGRERE